MIRQLLSVGGFTLLSRVTGFARDIVLGAVLGAGAVADAFVVAFRLPNHFRAIFGEGAFNAAFVPSYARVLETQGLPAARLFSSRIYSLLIVVQLAVLALALVFAPQLVDLLAPGFRKDPEKFALAVSLTRITFPYLLFVTLVTLHAGALNATERFAAAAFAPVLLNLSMIVALSCAFLFPNAGYAAAAGVVIAGFLELLLVEIAARRAGVGSWLEAPRFSEDIGAFFRALGPAVIGSAGVQIALFADTIIASMLPTGGPSSIYYADRIYQLPIGVIGVAAGAVILPQMSRSIAAGAPQEALRAQNRAMALTVALTTPFAVAFLALPDLILQAAFVRGKYTTADALASAAVLSAYACGLFAVVLIASARASFQARGDTTVPMIAALTAVAINVALKIALFQPLGAAGLAFATSVGAWINFLILFVLAVRADFMTPNATFGKTLAASALSGAALAAFVFVARGPAAALAQHFGHFHHEIQLAALGLSGAFVYVAVFVGAARLARLDIKGLRPARRAPSAARRAPSAAAQADADRTG